MNKCKLHNIDLKCDDCSKSDDVECTKCPFAEDVHGANLAVHLCVNCYYLRTQEVLKVTK